MAEIINRKGIAECIAGVAAYIKQDFLRWNDFDKCARVANHSDVGVIELMPVADARTYAFKYVNGHPANYRHNLPTVMAFGVLADVETGIPNLISELTITTAIRTAAMSAVAAGAMARPDSRTMALIGNGRRVSFRRWPSITCSASRLSISSISIPVPPTSWSPTSTASA